MQGCGAVYNLRWFVPYYWNNDVLTYVDEMEQYFIMINSCLYIKLFVFIYIIIIIYLFIYPMAIKCTLICNYIMQYLCCNSATVIYIYLYYSRVNYVNLISKQV